ncbi:RNA-dependent DNA polymerase [Leptolyngbya sp. 'hensonii']|nr:RNA-directed DNA polymerase [Leptolyngbya sp. 'hensonii']OLP18404.1 RNA-dependent DNA polymerase [Leptolyngbya sp. 'hensonii']
MKRFRDLWSQITQFANLLDAAKKAQRGKRYRANVLAFNYNRESELLQLQEELRTQTYQPGAYRTFEIVEPKKRLISAAPYRDRVVHHALCNIIVPLVEPSFIYDSYANRIGKGTHRALDRFTRFARSSRYVLQCDIQKYFPSIDHQILKIIIRQKIKCQETLWLIDTIIDNSNEQPLAVFHFPGDDILTPLERRRGLPIGNLTSQFFANWYLNGFDQFVKGKLRVKKYVRYVDDFALFSDDWGFLKEAQQAIDECLAAMRLKVHPVKSQLFETRHGANFLGFRILPDRIRVRIENLRRGRRRLRRLQAAYTIGQISLKELMQSLQSWDAHLQHGDTWQLRQQIFTSLDLTRG